MGKGQTDIAMLAACLRGLALACRLIAAAALI
jgi:hypothetical protein